jgi:hypothetical protein
MPSLKRYFTARDFSVSEACTLPRWDHEDDHGRGRRRRRRKGGGVGEVKNTCIVRTLY